MVWGKLQLQCDIMMLGQPRPCNDPFHVPSFSPTLCAL